MGSGASRTSRYKTGDSTGIKAQKRFMLSMRKTNFTRFLRKSFFSQKNPAKLIPLIDIIEASMRVDESEVSCCHSSHPTTILNAWLNAIDSSSILNDEAGYQSVYANALKYHKEKALLLWHSIVHLPDRVTRTESNKVFSDFDQIVSMCVDDDMVQKKMPLAEIKRLKCVASGMQLSFEIDTAAMEELARMLYDKIVFDELESWKKSPNAQDYYFSRVGFRELLEDEYGMYHFHRYLAVSFASENMDFYQTIENYRHAWESSSSDDNFQLVNFIYRLYIRRDAPLQVNLPQSLLSEIEYKIDIGGISVAIFDKAQQEILKILENDAWSRYRRHRLAGVYLNSRERISIDGLPSHSERGRSSVHSSAGIRTRMEYLREFLKDEDLLTVLSNEFGMDSFNKYFTAKYPKNGSLKLWQAIVAFKSSRQHPNLSALDKETAKGICQDHLVNKGMNMINVSEEAQAHVQTQLTHSKNMSVLVFDPILQELEAFFLANCFQHYKTTDLYTQYRLVQSKVNDNNILR